MFLRSSALCIGMAIHICKSQYRNSLGILSSFPLSTFYPVLICNVLYIDRHTAFENIKITNVN